MIDLTNIKLFLVDLDGVVVHRADFFSNRSKELYPDANHEAIIQFFTGGAYKQTALGKKDLVEALTEALPSWEVSVPAEEVLSTWFAGENDVDKAVLGRIQEIRKQGVPCVIATDHSQYRKHDVWENLGMKNHFDGIIASADMGATKEDTAFYQYAREQFGISSDPNMVMFTDDDPENVEVAQSLGIHGVEFTSIESLQ